MNAILYHDSDLDGKLSNAVCRHFLKGSETHSYGWDYGRPIPIPLSGDWAAYTNIFIVDLSVDPLMELAALRNKIVWIDHHQSAIEKWDSTPYDADPNPEWFPGFRLDGVAACRLCWQWFISNDTRYQEKQEFIERTVAEPLILTLCGEHDIWDHHDCRTWPVHFALNAMDDSSLAIYAEKHLSGLYSDDEFEWNALIDRGNAIQAYVANQAALYAAAHAHTIIWHGVRFCAINGPKGSQTAESAVRPEHDAIFCWRYDGKVAQVSLYQVPGKDIDLSVIAKAHGGGGHKGACGFRLSLLQLANLLSTMADSNQV